jgi:RpiR family carbohydrate utilization transcriptional regulator
MNNTSNESTPALLLRLQALLPKLSRAEKKVVEYVLSHPEEVIHLSVSGLAENSNVSDATVVRTCRNIGFDGFQHFKVTLAQGIVTPLQSIHEEIHYDDTVEQIIEKVFQGNLHTLNFTHNILSASAIEAAAAALMKAQNVYIYGLGNSHAVSLDLQHKLLRLGIHAYAFTDSHLQTIAATYITDKDLLFAISHSGSTVDVVECAKIAKNNGAVVISLTNIGSSPLSRVSDIKLYTASKETKYRIVAMSSRIAQMAIIDTIYTIIATRIPDISEKFHNIEKALETKKY